MKVGILGTGDVGKSLAKGFLELGHEVMLGSRDAEKARGAAKEVGGAKGGLFSEAARFGELVALATLGTATEAVLANAGPANFAGKTVIDATNPLDFSGGMPPKLVGGPGSSAGEQAQRILQDAHVVKAFNTVGNAFFFRPKFAGGPPDMFICGDQAEAKKKVTAICHDFGWGTVDVGGISSSHYLESMCLVWVISAALSNQWAQAFKMLK